ncbi:MAG: hypothetical protein WC438_02545 [Candidatus Pacearchaeota archaeon]
MKILFICRHNRFRSKVAEAVFNKISKNKKNKAESAGILIEDSTAFASKNVVKIMNDLGYSVKIKSRRVTSLDITKFDLLIIVANNVEKEYFWNFKGKIIKWNIPDTNENNLNEIKRIVKTIETKVKKLVKELR